jgi:hypothetical protein
MGHLMPIFSTAYAHVGQLVCPVCTRVVNTMRARLRELVESPLVSSHGMSMHSPAAEPTYSTHRRGVDGAYRSTNSHQPVRRICARL